MVNSHSPSHCPLCFCAFKDMYILITKTWAEKCPSVYSFHCLPNTSIFLYCQMNLFPLILKSLWLWKQNEKLPEPSKSVKIYCLINLNMSYYIILPETRFIRLLHCQWSISFCMVWEPREGSTAADSLPTKTWATFPNVSSSSRCLLLHKALDSLGAPQEACIPVFLLTLVATRAINY